LAHAQICPLCQLETGTRVPVSILKADHHSQYELKLTRPVFLNAVKSADQEAAQQCAQALAEEFPHLAEELFFFN
jgi:hypothetical protein